MEIKILAFGHIAEIFGKSTWELSGVKDTDELKNKLSQERTDLLKINFTFAVNKIVIQKNTILQQNDIVALLPPFSGG